MVATALSIPAIWRFGGPGSRLRLLFASVLVLTGKVQGHDATMVRESVRLRLGAPVRQATLAASLHDFRYLAVAGFGLGVPGAPKELQNDGATRDQIREILGVGCAGNQYDELYQAASTVYAEQYNRTILRLRDAAPR